MKCEKCENNIEDGEKYYELMSSKIEGTLGNSPYYNLPLNLLTPEDSLLVWCSECEQKRKPLEFDNG